ncbi:MAG: hypothetical protein AAFN74_13790 [Myxococcota bacterium]
MARQDRACYDPRTVARAVHLSILVLSTAVLHCGGCEKSTGLREEGVRVWGREKIDDSVKARAQQPIDTGKLDVDTEMRARVLEMPFDEVVTRFGFLKLEAEARFELSRNGHQIPVYENTTIDHGLQGSFRVLQKDKDGDVTREAIFTNGVLYVRNGAKAKMRVQGIINDQHRAIREESWSPLKTFTGYFGPRLGLRQGRTRRINGRATVRYRLQLVDGPELIEVPGMRGKKKPIALSGDLYVDEKTGVPTQAKLQAELQIPGAPDAQPGVLKLFLDMKITAGKAEEIKPESFVPTIAHRPVDLDPLRFLKGDTRTSTVIGGRR